MTDHERYRPIPGDGEIPEVQLMLGRLGAEHLLVQTVTTMAVEAFKDDGSNHQHAVVVELEGRFNNTTTPGTQLAVLNLEAALILYSTLEHTLAAIIDQGAK